jgi:hypothetical protein
MKLDLSNKTCVTLSLLIRYRNTINVINNAGIGLKHDRIQTLTPPLFLKVLQTQEYAYNIQRINNLGNQVLLSTNKVNWKIVTRHERTRGEDGENHTSFEQFPPKCFVLSPTDRFT